MLADLLELVFARTPRHLWIERAGEPFSLVEHACHLADLEEDAYAVRITRLANEDNPSLPDFAGDVIARERRYLEQDPLPAIARFRAARAANQERLRNAPDWQRRGTQEGVGEVTIARVAEMMLHHDVAHANELVALLHALGVPVPEELAEFASHDPLAKSA
jgi:hypothetical protein